MITQWQYNTTVKSSIDDVKKIISNNNYNMVRLVNLCGDKW
jgi:hypothetical protein